MRLINKVKSIFRQPDAADADSLTVDELAFKIAEALHARGAAATQADLEAQLLANAPAIKATGVGEEEFLGKIAICRKRIGWDKIVAEGPAREAKAKQSAERLAKFERDETERRRLADEEHRRLRNELARDEEACVEIVPAKVGLEDTGEVSAQAEAELTARQRTNNATIAERKVMLDPNARVGGGSGLSIDQTPAALAADLRRLIAEQMNAAVANPPRLAELKRKLKVVDAAVKKAEVEFAAATREAEEIARQFKALGEMRLLPENFKWVAPKPQPAAAPYTGPSARDLVGVQR